MSQSKQLAPGLASTSSGSGLKRRKRDEKLSANLVVVRKPDGRECKLCGERDDSHDPLALHLKIDLDISNGETIRAWGYPANLDGSTVGDVCWYCMRIYEGKYKAKGYTLTSLRGFCGSTADALEKFRKL